MTDPTTNNLPMTDPLSPAAQAVLDAIANLYWDRIDPSDVSSSAVAAAALRAVAELPNELEISFNVITDWENIPGSCARLHAAATWGYNQALAAQLAIATELENHQ